MAITQKTIPHIFRNKYLKNSSGGGTTYIGSTSNGISHTHENKDVLDSITAIDVESWKNKLDKAVWDKAFIIDESNNLRVKLNLIGEQEVSAYGSGSTGGSGGVVTIVDNLVSTATDCALSANQGRVLKSLIDNKTGVSSWNDLTDKPSTFTPSAHNHTVTDITNLSNLLDGKAATSHTHTIANITSLQSELDSKADNATLTAHISNTTVHITAAERTNWNVAYTNNHTHSNKSVLDGITSTKISNWDSVYTNWNKAFEFDADNNLRVKLNLIGEGEVSAYGSGSTSGSGGVVTIVDNLASTSTDAALSANQGRVLKSLIDNKTSVSSWNDLKDKPSTFTPAAHTHIVTDITNLSNLLDGKAAASHTHNYTSTVKIGTTAYNVVSNVISLPAYPTTLPASDVYAWAKAATKPSYSWSEIGSKPTTFTPSAHSHTIADISNISSASVNYANSAGSATYASYLPTAYIGGAQYNPQTYFGAGMGVRAAMTGAWSVWSDTLWVNGYSGGDVPYMCALHFLRNGSPRMAISTQTSTGTSYGSIYEVLTDYNYNSRCPTLSGSGASGTWGINITGISKGLESIATTTGNNMTDRPWQLWYWNQWVGDTAGIPASYMCGLNMRAQDANYGMQLGTTAFNDVLYFRKYNGGTYRPWQIIATTDSNVYSATKLQTARTIWGQSFDGTGNVDDTFRNISVRNTITHKTLKYPTAPYGLITRIEDSGTVSLQSQRESNDSECFPLILNPNGGNVGIGTAYPYYKLEVAGDVKSQGWFRTIGTQGWYNDTYGGGWHMEDDTYLRSFNSKAVLITNSTYYSCNTMGGYHSNASYGVGGTTWADVSSYLDHVFIVANKYTPVQCYNRILGWADVMDGVGYQTRYGISSLRNGYQFGAMAFSVTNNDAGTNGHQLLLYANGLMDWTGNIVAAGEITAYSSSDKRMKKDIKSINGSLAIIEKLNPVQFKWNKKAKELNQVKDDRLNYGLIAQEVEEVLPELVHPIYDKYKSVDYEQLIPFLIQSIKELKSEIDTLKNNNNTKQTI